MANSDDRYEMLRDRELSKLSWVVNVWALSGAGKRTAASGVAWSGCASLRGPLCAGEALLEARTQASVALFKLGAHSATLRPEFGGPKSLRCCCAKGVGHRAQLMLRARRGARENDYPVPLLRTPTPQKLSLSCPHSEHNYRVPRLAATLPTESGSPPAPQGGWPRLKSCRSRRARFDDLEKVALVLVLVEMLEGVLCGGAQPGQQ